jgi:formylglycine-generating enzyme required for sulfatase activity
MRWAWLLLLSACIERAQLAKDDAREREVRHREVASAPPPSCPAGEVYVPATPPEGFVMGKAGSVDDRAHRVVLTAPFCIDATEVTVGAYRACVERGACELPRTWGMWINYPDKTDHPINKVNWRQARAFCVASGKSLPTEAQWEWAATGGDARSWAWGDEPPTCAHADFTAGILRSPSSDDGCHGGGTSPVGTHPAGDHPWPAGAVHDLSGNVWEWVLDNPGPYPADLVRDPVRLENDEGAHIVRGGGWNRSAEGIRVRYRGIAPVTYQVPGLGFRCLRPLPR